MDPNESLRQLRISIAQYAEHETLPTYDDVMTTMNHLTALDEWLSKGGFLPDDWEKSRPDLRATAG